MPRVGRQNRRALAAAMIAALALVVGVCREARAEDMVRILSAGAAQGAVQRLEPAVAAAAHAKLDAVYDTVGALRDRVLRGETADVVILSEAGMAAVEKAGKVAAGSVVDLGRISVALAVRKGAAVPAITSPETLKQALLSAGSIAHADPARGATAGAHFARVLVELGIADELKSRVTVLSFGGDVVADVARGRFEIGVSQSSEIAAHPGVVLVGPLPAPYRHDTRYVAAKLVGAGPRADAVLAVLRTPDARAAFAGLGFETGP